jgi:beta-glucanase (GH16 family)
VNANGLDLDHWNIETELCVNQEQQIYTADTENVRVQDGVLILEARDPDPSRQDCPGCEGVWSSQDTLGRFTSGRIQSKDKGEFLYGRIEARMQLPLGEGLWPAFWMLGADIDEVGWPECGELDIMENLGYDDWVAVAAHGPGFSGAESRTQRYDLPAGETVGGWHTYRLDWTEDNLRWYVDGVNVHSLLRLTLQLNDQEWVYDHPHFIVLNLALGGHYPYSENEADAPVDGCYGLPQATIDALPKQVQVDWVRVCKPRS